MPTSQDHGAGSAQARELGTELWRIRKRAGVTGREIARTLHYDKSKVSRIENGTSFIRAIPHAKGPIGVLGCGFMLIDHAEHPSLAYVEAQTASAFTEEPSDIATYRRIVTKLDALALGAEQSREWVAHLATSYDHAKDGNGHGRADMAKEQL